MGYGPWVCKESDGAERRRAHTQYSQGNLPRRGLRSGWEGPQGGCSELQGGLPDNLPPGQAVKLTPALGPRCRWTGSSLAPQKVAQGQLLLKTNRRSESLTASSAFCQRQSLQIPGR